MFQKDNNMCKRFIEICMYTDQKKGSNTIV